MTAVTGDGDAAEPVTFARFAEMIGKSRPYVSKLKANGVLHGPAFAPDGRLWPDVAREQMSAAADPARGPGGRPATIVSSEGSYAAERARKTKADADRAEIELAVRRGELITRASVGEVLMPALRELRDAILDVPRDVLLDPVLEADVRNALARKLDDFATRLARIAAEMNDGGAAPAA